MRAPAHRGLLAAVAVAVATLVATPGAATAAQQAATSSHPGPILGAVGLKPGPGPTPKPAPNSTPTPMTAGTVTFDPGPLGGAFSDQQTVQLIVSANETFRRGTSFQMLECADPAGTVAGLPRNNAACDHHTLQTATIPRNGSGGLVVVTFTFHLVPDPTFGEGGRHKPTCDETHACVLYVGRDNRDFNQPKIFSSPFFLTPLPPPNIPESPYAVLLPVAAVVVGGGIALLVRRRNRGAPPTQ